MSRISAVIITYNEEAGIVDCLETLKWVDEIIIVDGFSTDRTAEICKQYTNKIYFNDFKDFSFQKNFGLAKANYEWIFSLDADERVTDALRDRISKIVKEFSKEDGYFIKRKNYIYGKEFRYGGHDKDFQLRLFKREGAEFIQPIHEKVILKNNNIGRINEFLEHYSTKNISEHIKKINQYTDLEAKYLLQQNKGHYYFYMIVRPPARFFQRYVLQKGFMDGMAGFIYYLLSSFYDFLKYAKCIEKIKLNICGK